MNHGALKTLGVIRVVVCCMCSGPLSFEVLRGLKGGLRMSSCFGENFASQMETALFANSFAF